MNILYNYIFMPSCVNMYIFTTSLVNVYKCTYNPVLFLLCTKCTYTCSLCVNMYYILLASLQWVYICTYTSPNASRPVLLNEWGPKGPLFKNPSRVFLHIDDLSWLNKIASTIIFGPMVLIVQNCKYLPTTTCGWFYPSNPKSQSHCLLSICIVLFVLAYFCMLFRSTCLWLFSVDNPPRVATEALNIHLVSCILYLVSTCSSVGSPGNYINLICNLLSLTPEIIFKTTTVCPTKVAQSNLAKLRSSQVCWDKINMQGLVKSSMFGD